MLLFIAFINFFVGCLNIYSGLSSVEKMPIGIAGGVFGLCMGVIMLSVYIKEK